MHRFATDPDPAVREPAARPAPAGPGALRLVRIAGARVTDRRRLVDDDHNLEFLTGTVVEYGLPVRTAFFQEPVNTFSTLATVALERLEAAGGLGGPVDLALLAHAAPDSHVHEVPASFAVGALPGEPFAFTINDQNVTASFTALSLAHAYARRRPTQRVAVFFFDQELQPYPTPTEPHLRVDGDAVVLLVLESDPAEPTAGPLDVRLLPGVPPGQVQARLGEQISALFPDPGERPRLLLGPGLDPAWPLPDGAGAAVASVRRVPPGLPSTGLWLALAEELDGRAADGARPHTGPLLLADYDRTNADLSVCRVGRAAG